MDIGFQEGVSKILSSSDFAHRSKECVDEGRWKGVSKHTHT